MRWLWTGEGDGPEKWGWKEKKMAGGNAIGGGPQLPVIKDDSTLDGGEHRGGLKKIGTLVGRVKGGLKQMYVLDRDCLLKLSIDLC